ncbi:GroES-like protein [Thozetella sp. PMI_491]|nr:GroES-like protein [Thozetella sp. PMI_491]
MDAVIFSGPFNITIERRPKPEIKEPTDAIVKVSVFAICGSDLHSYRGHQQSKTGHIMDHEIVGIVELIGSKVSRVKPGDRVVCIFSVACMTCWYCADYARVPCADGTLFPAPPEMDDKTLLMMCDIFPTGYYGVTWAMNIYSTPDSSEFQNPRIQDSVFVILGCGPVGLCAVLTARAKGVGHLFAVDSVDDRLEKHGVILDATDGRGADSVVEVVGNIAALRSAYDLVRPCGMISSVGFHQGEMPFTAQEGYNKNVTVNFGRAPVRRVFREALGQLRALEGQLTGFFTHDLPLSDAAHGYEIFDKKLARNFFLRPRS